MSTFLFFLGFLFVNGLFMCICMIFGVNGILFCIGAYLFFFMLITMSVRPRQVREHREKEEEYVKEYGTIQYWEENDKD